MSAFYVVDERPSGVQFGSNGVKLQRSRTAGVRRNNLDGHRLRGKMDGRFSRSSALNLRRKLACLLAKYLGHRVTN